MTNLSRFLEYAFAFEVAQASGEGAAIERFFAPDARHRVDAAGPFGCDDRGRSDVVKGLLDSVARIDRRFDLRIPEVLDGPLVRDDGIWMRFGLRLRRAGLPDLPVEGEHLAAYDDEGLITRIDEKLLGGCDEAATRYLAANDAALRPAGSAVLPPASADLPDFRDALQRTLVRAYAQAKSHQDTTAALSVCTPSFGIDTIPFGLASKDKADTEGQLGLFFSIFPDYRAETEGLVSGEDGVGWWGRILLTFDGPLLGHAPTGRKAELPAFSVFEFENGLLSRERFMFDLGALCDGIGVPLADVTDSLRALRGV